MTSVTNSCGATTYTWNARNQLVGINGFNADCSVLTASFKYDALGRRIEKSVTDTVNGTRTTNYLYDGLDIVQEIENGMVTANYIRTLNIDEPLARIKADGTVRYYQQDALGSVIALTDEIGNIKTQYVYDPFGNTTVMGEPSDNPFQYTGRENDGTGLYYYRARYYSPELQRFISEDPIGLDGGINLYAYVRNNPLNRKDPLGLAQAVFNGSTLSLWTDSGTYLGTWSASSGQGGNVNEVGLGPIPSGLYVAEPGSTQTAGIFSPIWYFFGQDSWGTQRLSLTPYPGTETYGRSGFFIHGGSHNQTSGCIRVPNERSFFEAWESTNEMLWLTVNYGKRK